MKTHFSLQTMCHALHDSLPCVWLCVLAAGLPVSVLGQSIYTNPYTFTTLAGKAGLAGSRDGTNSAAWFNFPCGMAVDGAGNLYVTEWNNDTLRKVTPAGVVTTLAGHVGIAGQLGGTGTNALFYSPDGVAVDSAGSVYVADYGDNTIRKVTPTGADWVVLTLAGGFSYPHGLAVDTNGNVYVGDTGNNRVAKVTPGGEVTTVASGFNQPAGLAMDNAGNLYVADWGNNRIRKLAPVGTNSVARFNNPCGVALDSAGNVYVADANNNTIRKGFPASPVPPPIVQPPSLIAGQFGFGITGLPGLAVNIESSSDLSRWQMLSPYITLAGGSNYFVSPSPSFSAQFYRAKLR